MDRTLQSGQNRAYGVLSTTGVEETYIYILFPSTVKAPNYADIKTGMNLYFIIVLFSTVTVEVSLVCCPSYYVFLSFSNSVRITSY